MDEWTAPSGGIVTTMVLVVPIDELAQACDVVWTHGAYGFEERDVDAEHVELVLAPDEALAQALEGSEGSRRWSLRYEHTDAAVLEGWRQWVEPIWIDDALVVEPAWAAGRVMPPDNGRAGVGRIIIDPEASFGMGDHPTTLLCARALRETMTGSTQERPTVLDVGCGSGLLSIVAAVSGSGPVRAIDLSASAVDTTRRNAARNGVEIDASTTPLRKVTERFDIVVANLLAPIIDELAEQLIAALTLDGVLIVSGLLEEQLDSARERLCDHGRLVETAVALQSGWGAVRFVRPATDAPR